MSRFPSLPGGSNAYHNARREEQIQNQQVEQQGLEDETKSDGPAHPQVSVYDFAISSEVHGTENQTGSPHHTTILHTFHPANTEPQWPERPAEPYDNYMPWIASHQEPIFDEWGKAFLPINTLPFDPSSFFLMNASGANTPTSQVFPSDSSSHSVLLPNTDDFEAGGLGGIRESLEIPLPSRSVEPRQGKGKKKLEVDISKTSSSRKSARVTKSVREPVSNKQFRACWRCKKYRKSCDESPVCNSCVMTSGFRVWPSSLGCRRGTLEECVLSILPENYDEALRLMNYEYIKPFSWRHASETSQQTTVPVDQPANDDLYDNTIRGLQSTHVHGPGIVELLHIGARFQRKQVKEDTGLRSTFASLCIVIELYGSLISIDEAEFFDPAQDLRRTFHDAQKALVRSTDKFLHSCLTGRLKSWPSTFLSATVGVIAFILLADAIAAIPDSIRCQVWDDIQQTVLDLRKNLYDIAQELLLALSKGAEMLNMNCWNYIEDSDIDQSTMAPKLVPNNHGMELMEQDKTAFEAMTELAQWREDYFALLNEDSWMSTAPFHVDLLMIKSLSRLFSASGSTQEGSGAGLSKFDC